MRLDWLLTAALLASLLLVALTTHHEGTNRAHPELAAHGDSLGRLNDLEDRTFSLVQLDSRDGSIPLVGTLGELNALAQEARQADMPGCVGQARDALVSAMEEIAQGGYEASAKVERYVNAANACETALAEQERRSLARPS